MDYRCIIIITILKEIYHMSDVVNQDSAGQERKKISLQEAIKQKLANQKEQAKGKSAVQHSNQAQKMKSQQNKKANNQRRRTGV